MRACRPCCLPVPLKIQLVRLKSPVTVSAFSDAAINPRKP